MRGEIESDFGAFFITEDKEMKEVKRAGQRVDTSIRRRAGNTISFNYFYIDVMIYISNRQKQSR